MADPQAETNVTLENCAPENLEFNRREHLVSSNRVSFYGTPYARPQETLITANVGAWYETACYWRDKTEAAEARNEALLQALKEIGNFVGTPILSYTSYLEKEMEFLARIHKVSSIVRTALDSGSASQEAKTPGGGNA